MIPSDRVLRRVFCSLSTALILDSTAHAQQEAAASGDRRTVHATRMMEGERIIFDGRLDEPIWARAVPATDFIQIDPNNGEPATEQTEVRIVFDHDRLYLGVTAHDSESDRWLGYQRRRDEFLMSDDRFMWTIDTFLDARTGYFFEMNPSGLMADSIFGVNGDNRAWDGIWDGRVHHSTIGWTLEIEIPFRTLNFNPENDTWGINFQRTVRRKDEDSIWMGWVRNQGLRRMTNAGHVTGLTGMTQGHGLDIKPYGLFTANAAPGRGQGATDKDGSAGVDFFYNPTPLLRTNLTLNTDLAQTEVDQRQVNLTQFSLFFPEKRGFFLDGAIFFDFASPSTVGFVSLGGELLVNPFFSRRIGLSSDGTPQRIDVGAKLTGQVGGQDVGLLYVRTGEENGMIGEDFVVARLKRRMLRQSYIGAIYTRRDARVGDALQPGVRDGGFHTAGLDLRLATSQFLGSQNLVGTFWFLHAARPGISDGNHAFGAQIEYPNDLWNITVPLREVQQNFDPAIGFVTRRGYRRFQPNASFRPRPSGHPYIRQFTFGPEGDIQTDLDGNLLVRNMLITPFAVDLHSQDTFGSDVIWSRERLERPFNINISRGITLPAGAEYAFTRWRLRGQTANRRVLALSWRFEDGDFYSGTRRQTMLNFTVRVRPGYIVYLNGEWNDVKLREGSFVSNVYRIIGETQFTPYIALANNIQFDTVSRVAGWQSRFRWIMKPGNDLYVVYTHNWLEDPSADRFSSLDRRLASKVLYTHRF